MTGIFQIFDRYKALAARKRGDKPVANIVTANYVFNEDGGARRASPKRAERRRAQWEALRDTERSSSIDTDDVVVKPLTSTEEIQQEIVQKPSPSRVSSDIRPKPRLSFYPPNDSQAPEGSPMPLGDAKEPSLQSESLVSGRPSKASVTEPNLRKDGLKLPPRDTSVILKVKDKTRASPDNGKTPPAYFVEATDMVRGLMQLEDTQSSADAKEGYRRQLSTVTSDGLRYPSSGTQREDERYEPAMQAQKEGRRQHTSGGESEGHKCQSFGDWDRCRYPSGNESQSHQAYADQKDDDMHHLYTNGERRSQSSGYVNETTRYQSSGDETDSQTYLSPPERVGQRQPSHAKKGQRYQSSGKEREGYKFHTSSERRGASRHSPFVDREARGSYGSSDRSQPRAFRKSGDRYESSGGDWDSYQFSVQRRDGRRHQSPAKVKEGHRHLSSSDEIGGGRRYYSSIERHESPRHQPSAAGKKGQSYQDSSGDERNVHRYHSAIDPKEGDRYHASPKEGHRRYSPAHNEGHRQQLWFDGNDHHRYQSSGDDRTGHRYASSQGRPHRGESSSRVNGWHRYQSSGVERRVQRSYISAGDREGGHRHYTSAEAKDGRRNQSIEDEREGLRQLSADVQESGRRRSSAKDCRRQQSLYVGDGNRQRLLAEAEKSDRGQSTGDGLEGHRYHAFAQEDNRYSSLTNLSVEGRRNNYDVGVTRGRSLESFNDANEGRELESPLALEGDHRRNSSSDGWGGPRRQPMKPTKEGRRHQQSLDWRPSQLREKDLLSGHRKDLPPRSSGSKSSVSPRNLMDIRDLARLTVQMREGNQLSVSKEQQGREPQNLTVAIDTRQISTVESGSAVARTYQDFKDTLRAIDYRDSQYNLKKGRDGSSRNSVDGRDLPRTSSVSRLSVDSRQLQSSTPRLSVDGRPDALRASSLHSSRASMSSVDAQPQFRTNSLDSSGSVDTKRRGPSIVARLMGLAELPTLDIGSPMSDRPPTREGKLPHKVLDSTPPQSPATDHARTRLHLSEVAQQMKQVSARLQKESHAKPKSERKSRSSSSRSRSFSQPPQSQLDTNTQAMHFQQQQGFGNVVESRSPQPPKLPMSPKHHQMEGMPNVFKKRAEGVLPSDVDQRLHQLRIKNSIQEHKTLKQILEAMHLKGLLHPPRNKQIHVLKLPSLKVEKAQPPLKESNQKLALVGNLGRSRRLDLAFQDVLGLQDSATVQEEPAPEADINGEASIVVMKPLNHQPVTLPAPIIHPLSHQSGDVEEERPNGLPGGSGNLTAPPPASSITMSSSDLGKSRNRGRSSSRQAMTGGKASRSRSQESPVQSTLQEDSPDQFAFANVMLSWRERIAAEHSKHIADGKEGLDTKVPAVTPPLVKRRTWDLSLSKSGSTSRSAIESETEQEVLSSRAQEKLGMATLMGGKDSQSSPTDLQHETPSESHVRDGTGLETSKAVGRGESEEHLAAPSAEVVILPEIASGRASLLDRAPAEVAVLRSKRPTGKASRPKLKIRWSPSAGVRIEDPASMTQEPGMGGVTAGLDPSMDSNQKLETTTDGRPFTGSPIPIESSASMWANSTDNPTSMQGSIELEVSAEVTEKEQDSHLVATEEAHMPNSEDESVYGNADDSPDAAGTTPSSPAGSTLGAQQEADVEDVVEETTEGYTLRVISLEKAPYVQEESGEFNEGTSHPSPVSVLDSPGFNDFHLEELTPSPDSVKTGAISSGDVEGPSDDHETTDAEPPAPYTSEVTKEIPDFLKDIYNKVARSLELNDKELYISKPGLEFQLPFITGVDDTLKNTRESTLEKQEERAYVRDILIKSRLTDEPSSFAKDLAEIMHFDVFTRKEEELQTEELDRIDRGELDKNEERRYKESIDRRLIFDGVNEILEGKMRPFLNPLPWAPPVLRMQSSGHLLVDEVWDSLQDLHWPVTDAYDAIYAVLQKDFTRKEFQWLDFTIEIGEVGVEVEHMIFSELVDETAQNVMSINQVQKKKQPTPPQEAAAPVEDPECRRKELLERSRMDLLAWQVQYQQL